MNLRFIFSLVLAIVIAFELNNFAMDKNPNHHTIQKKHLIIIGSTLIVGSLVIFTIPRKPDKNNSKDS